MPLFADIVFALLCTFLFPAWIADSSLSFSNSTLAVVFCGAVFLLCRKARADRADGRMLKYTYTLGFLFACMTAFGYSLNAFGEVRFTDWKMIASVIVYTRVFSMGICLFWKHICEREKAPAKADAQNRFTLFVRWLFRRPVLVAGIMLLCWVPCFLSIYPGNFVYDAETVFNQTGYGFNDAIPYMHSWFVVNALLKSLAWTGYFNRGIAFLTLLQMLLLASLFSFILCTLHRRGVSAAICFAGLLYYSLFPTVALLATCPVRDVTFGLLITLSAFLIWLAVKDPAKFSASASAPVLLGICIAVTVLSRNNSDSKMAYLLLLLFCVICLLWCREKKWRCTLLFSAFLFGCYVVLSLFFSGACQPHSEYPSTTSLSFLTQPISRAWVETGSTWSEEEQAEYARYFETEGLLYADGLGDISASRLKTTADENGGHLAFLRFWCREGIRHPAAYLNAWLANSKALWSPCAVLNGYNYDGARAYGEMEKSYFSFSEEIDSPGTFNGKFPLMHRFYSAVATKLSFEKVPLLSALFSVSFHFWVLLSAFFLALYRKDNAGKSFLFILLLYTLITAFVPIILVRYFSALFFVFPPVLSFLLPGETGDPLITFKETAHET